MAERRVAQNPDWSAGRRGWVVTDLPRLARKISRCLGVEVVLTTDYDAKTPLIYGSVDDSAQSGLVITRYLGPPSKRELALKLIHESIYRGRAKRKYQLQSGLCAHCSRPLRAEFETDHIVTRAKGRDDSLDNLQCLCHRMSRGGCDYHQRKHGLSGQRRSA